MERYDRSHIEGGHLFFIRVGCEDELTKLLEKITVRVSMRMFTSIEYLRKMPIPDLLNLVEEIREIDKERGNGK